MLLQETKAYPVPVAAACSREDEFENGRLVDASGVARQIGFSWAIALTQACWRDCISWDDEDNDRKGLTEDEDGRLWDVMLMAAEAVKNASHRGHATPEMLFSVYRIPRAGLFRSPRRVELLLTLGFEQRSVVGTISLASED